MLVEDLKRFVIDWCLGLRHNSWLLNEWLALFLLFWFFYATAAAHYGYLYEIINDEIIMYIKTAKCLINHLQTISSSLDFRVGHIN